MGLRAMKRSKVYKSLTQEEKGHLLDILCEVYDTGLGFFLNGKKSMPLNDTQIAPVMSMELNDWLRVRTALESKGILYSSDNGGLCIAKAGNEQGVIPVEKSQLSISIIDQWNEAGKDIKGWIKHKPTYATKVARAMHRSGTTLDEITEAIWNYAYVLSRPTEYFFSYQWTLDEFILRGADRFTNACDPKVRFLRTTKKLQPTIGPSILRKRQEIDLEAI